MASQDQGTPKLVIPAGVGLSVGEGGLSIEHSGDIVISGPLSQPVRRLHSREGSITVQGDLALGDVEAGGGSILLDGHIRVDRVIAHGGVVSLHGDVTAQEVRSPAGSVSMSGKVEVGSVSAAEEVLIDGQITARLIDGGFVKAQSGSLQARAVQGTVRVELGDLVLGVEVVIAPEVRVSAGTHGRVNVVESHNELDPNGLKGGFRLTEYAEFTGVNPEHFLAERGVRPLGARPQAPGAIQVVADDDSVDSDALELGEALVTDNEPRLHLGSPETIEVPLSAGPAVAAVAVPATAAPQQAADEDDDEPISIDEPGLPDAPEDEDEEEEEEPDVTVEALRRRPTAAQARPEPSEPEVVEPEAVEPEAVEPEALDLDSLDPDSVEPEPLSLELEPTHDPVREELLENLDRIAACYADRDQPPPAVEQLSSLINASDYAGIRDSITDLWHGLVGWHQRNRLRVPHQVTTTFNRINTLVRNA